MSDYSPKHAHNRRIFSRDHRMWATLHEDGYTIFSRFGMGFRGLTEHDARLTLGQDPF